MQNIRVSMAGLRRCWLHSLALLLLCLLSVSAPSVADTSLGVAQTYNADSSVLPGMVVEGQSKQPTSVRPLKSEDVQSMLGVVVPVNNAPVVLTSSSNSGNQQVLVAPNGRQTVLVSNQNGAVKNGDYLAASALPGIVMKADSTQTKVVGRADAAFNGTGALGTVPLKGTLGTNMNVAVGAIPAEIRLATNPLYQSSSKIPGFLSRIANTVAHKPVSIARVYLSLFVIAVMLFIAGSMCYSGVRTSIQAIGRNPLAKKSIVAGLLQTFAAALILFAAGVLFAYLILL